MNNVKSFMKAKLESKKPSNFMDGKKVTMKEIIERGGVVSIHAYKIIGTEEGTLTSVSLGNGEWMFANTQLADLLYEVGKEMGVDEVNKELMDSPISITFTEIQGKKHKFYKITNIE